MFLQSDFEKNLYQSMVDAAMINTSPLNVLVFLESFMAKPQPTCTFQYNLQTHLNTMNAIMETIYKRFRVEANSAKRSGLLRVLYVFSEIASIELQKRLDQIPEFEKLKSWRSAMKRPASEGPVAIKRQKISEESPAEMEKSPGPSPSILPGAKVPSVTGAKVPSEDLPSLNSGDQRCTISLPSSPGRLPTFEILDATSELASTTPTAPTLTSTEHRDSPNTPIMDSEVPRKPAFSRTSLSSLKLAKALRMLCTACKSGEWRKKVDDQVRELYKKSNQTSPVIDFYETCGLVFDRINATRVENSELGSIPVRHFLQSLLHITVFFAKELKESGLETMIEEKLNEEDVDKFWVPKVTTDAALRLLLRLTKI